MVDSHQARPRGPLLLPYQVRYVRDQSRLILVEKSRQIGLTWAIGYKLMRGLAVARPRRAEWVSSRDLLQARLLVEDCRQVADVLKIATDALRIPLLILGRQSKYVVQFANGSRAHALSSNPDAQAGKRGRRVLDEFALNPDPRRLYAIAYPGITWGGSLELVSTHRGSQNFFNELVQEVRCGGNPREMSHHRVTLADALEQGFLARLKLRLPADDARQGMDDAEYFDFVRQGCPDEATFLEEYMCVPSDDRTAFLSHEMISRCGYAADESWETDLQQAGGLLYLGVDVGRDHDLTVMWVLEQLGDVLYTRRMLTFQREPFEFQERELHALLDLPRLRRCCIDSTGMGRQFSERARRHAGAFRVEAVNFSGAVKEGLAYPLRAAFESQRVRVPDDPALRADLRAVKKEITFAGHLRFSADRGKNGHADRFWALALALHAARAPAGGLGLQALQLGDYQSIIE